MQVKTDLFTQDEMDFINSRGENSDALDRAYSTDKPNSGTTDKPKDGTGEEGGLPGGSDDGYETGDDSSSSVSDDDVDDGQKRSQFVPHGQFHKERTRRHAAEQEALDLRVKVAKAEERLAVLNELVQGSGSKSAVEQSAPTGSAWEEQDIDPEEDFPGAINQLRRRQQEDRDLRNNWQKQSEDRVHDSEQSQAYVRDAVAYARQNPEFANAYRHLMQTYHRELEAYGITDTAERNKHIIQEEKKLAKYAFERGQSPASVIMSLATARGFVADTSQAANNNTDTEESSESGGRDLAAASREVKGKVDAIKKASKSSTSLSGAGGGAKNDLTLDSILAMDDDEFYERVHKLPQSKRQKLLAR